jgi:DNA polymerase I
MRMQVLDMGFHYDQNGFPIVDMYGVDDSGKSCIKHATGFYHYLYVDAPDLQKASAYIVDLSKKIGIVTSVQKVKRFRPIGYQTKPIDMLKVIVKNPKDARLLQDFFTQEGMNVYESDVIFRDRFAIDHGITGAGWIMAPKDITLPHSDIIGVSDRSNAPLKILAIDIEALPKDDGSFPTANECPVILVSMAFNPPWRGQENIVMIAKNLDCDRKDIIMSNTEQEMLKKLVFIINEFDPDIISGYNVNGFDMPYLVDRANLLKIQFNISRDSRPPWCKSFMGKYSVSLTGRIMLDMLPAIKAIDKYRLKSYKLANVAKEILHSEKLDVKPSEMKELYNGKGINKFISYSRRDSVLVMQMIKELKVMDKYLALAKASGAFLQVVVNGGQSHMVEARLSNAYILEKRVMGVKQALDEDDFDAKNAIKGAIVLPPDIGLTEQVVILDYKSLYPTIMMAHNLCYTTEIRDEQPDCENIVSPSGGKFVPHSLYHGIIPRILTTLLSERIAAKKAMKTATTSDEHDALDAKQQAMKILLNSFYGYSGYTRARLFSKIIANSVTSYGRANLLRTCDIVKENQDFEYEGKTYHLRVVAGDTDSVFISISGHTIDFNTAKGIGTNIAKIVTSGLPKPMELVFEAYAKRVLIIAKKHYAMYRFEEPGVGKIKAKGIETVRRDWCNLTSKTLTKCLEYILIDGQVDMALDYARKALNDARSPDQGVIKELVLTRTLTKNPDNYDQPQPHSELVKKLKLRGVNNYTIGDRIPFVIVQSGRRRGKRKELMTARAEDPEYALENEVPIDTEYYVNKQLLPPLSRIFASFNISEEDLLQNSRQQSLFSF